MKKLLYLLPLLLGTSTIFAQIDSSDFFEAKEYYEADEFDDCIKSISKYLEQKPQHPEAYKIRGNCYLASEHYAKAKIDFLSALKIDSVYIPALFNLAYACKKTAKLDSAALYYKRITEIDPENAEAYLDLALVFSKTGGSESPLGLFEKAYQLDSNSADIMYYLTREYFYIANDTASAEKVLTKAVQQFPEDPDFVIFQGVISKSKGEFEQAIAQAQSAITLDSSAFYPYVLELEATMLLRTNQESIRKNAEGDYQFVDYHSFKTPALADQFEDQYQPLRERMLKGEVLGLDEYFQFYIAQAKQEDYSPYSFNRSNELREAWQNEDYPAIVEMEEELLEGIPLSLGNIYKLAIAYFETQDYENFKRIYAIYRGHINAILASGDGKTYETAYIVMTTSDQYVLMSHLGLENQMQALLHSGGHSFDMQKCISESEGEIEVYFNIDLPFGSLNGMFDD